MGDAAAGKEALGHHLALSVADLSVWCYCCQSYVEHDRLTPLVAAMRASKFGTGGAPATCVPVQPPPIAVGDSLDAPPRAMHGALGDPAWAAPRVTAVCDALARPGYRTCAAHEYRDEPATLAAKVALLARLVRASSHVTAYTGAGISTAAGVRDYASKSRTFAFGDGSPLDAEPTFAHRALAALHAAGLLHDWVQQNHDGLPQKAGFPQHTLNEIHGAWFDPSNPVVPMDGGLRSDLVEAMAETEQATDLCIVAGTSLAGMNADRVATTPARRARSEAGVQGTVLINLQRTTLDEQMQLRIFAPIDEVMAALAAELRLVVRSDPLPSLDGYGDVFVLPYTAQGQLAPAGEEAQITLDLRPGRVVRLRGQPDWDAERCGTIATVLGRDASGHYILKLQRGGPRASRRLGSWWIAAALKREVPHIPVLPSDEATARWLEAQIAEKKREAVQLSRAGDKPAGVEALREMKTLQAQLAECQQALGLPPPPPPPAWLQRVPANADPATVTLTEEDMDDPELLADLAAVVGDDSVLSPAAPEATPTSSTRKRPAE